MAFGFIGLFGCVTSPKINQYTDPEMKVTFNPTETRTVGFGRVMVDIPRNQPIGANEVGLACIPESEKFFQRHMIDPLALVDIFKTELEKANINAIGNNKNMFEDPNNFYSDVDIAVGARVISFKENACFPFAGFGNTRTQKSRAEMQIDWQVYDILSRKVILTITTNGAHAMPKALEFSSHIAAEEAFAQATRFLIADKGFQDIVVAKPKSLSEVTQNRRNYSSLGLSISHSQHAKTPVDYQNATVRIQIAQSHGSGFFVSDQGHILTNQHVVGKRKDVRVILQDGREFQGEVLRRDNIRDVALVKINLKPDYIFTLSKKLPQIGADAFAIGTPLSDAMQGTVSKGIISSIRKFLTPAQTFIQSDATIHAGSSGGPLIDATGNVIGISVMGLRDGNNGTIAGMNFFIPIQEALSVLKVKPDYPK